MTKLLKGRFRRACTGPCGGAVLLLIPCKRRLKRTWRRGNRQKQRVRHKLGRATGGESNPSTSHVTFLRQRNIHKLMNRLYALGFADRALKDLQNLVTDSSEPTLQSRAAWQLSLWYADQCSEEGARRCLGLLPVALRSENDPVRLRRAAIVEAECQEALGNMESAKLAISRALEL